MDWEVVLSEGVLEDMTLAHSSHIQHHVDMPPHWSHTPQGTDMDAILALSHSSGGWIRGTKSTVRVRIRYRMMMATDRPTTPRCVGSTTSIHRISRFMGSDSGSTDLDASGASFSPILNR